MKQWYKTRKKDLFYLKAKKNDIISRAYYKLEEIDKKYNLFKNNKKILDIGCSPGGWTQYILKKNQNQNMGENLTPTKKLKIFQIILENILIIDLQNLKVLIKLN